MTRRASSCRFKRSKVREQQRVYEGPKKAKRKPSTFNTGVKREEHGKSEEPSKGGSTGGKWNKAPVPTQRRKLRKKDNLISQGTNEIGETKKGSNKKNQLGAQGKKRLGGTLNAKFGHCKGRLGGCFTSSLLFQNVLVAQWESCLQTRELKQNNNRRIKCPTIPKKKGTVTPKEKGTKQENHHTKHLKTWEQSDTPTKKKENKKAKQNTHKTRSKKVYVNRNKPTRKRHKPTPAILRRTKKKKGRRRIQKSEVEKKGNSPKKKPQNHPGIRSSGRPPPGSDQKENSASGAEEKETAETNEWKNETKKTNSMRKNIKAGLQRGGGWEKPGLRREGAGPKKKKKFWGLWGGVFGGGVVGLPPQSQKPKA